MNTARLILGYVAVGVMILSGLVHSFVGWPAFTKVMRETNTPPDVVRGLAVPWHFTGAAMVTFGILAALLLRAPQSSVRSLGLLIIAAAYLVFGAAGLLLLKLDPTFLMFIVPGALLIVAALYR
jgi:hypothetical protein